MQEARMPDACADPPAKQNARDSKGVTTANAPASASTASAVAAWNSKISPCNYDVSQKSTKQTPEAMMLARDVNKRAARGDELHGQIQIKTQSLARTDPWECVRPLHFQEPGPCESQATTMSTNESDTITLTAHGPSGTHA